MTTERRPKTVRVRDIMTSCATALALGDSLADAARRFTNERISGAPVVDNGVLVGVLSKSDLVERSPFIPHSPCALVADVMSRKVVTVQASDPAMSAVRAMVADRVHRVIVVDKSDRPLGIVTTVDVLKALVRGEPLQDGEEEYVARSERHGAPASAIVSPNPSTPR